MTDSVVIGFLHPGTVRGEFMMSVVDTLRDESVEIEDVVDLQSGPNISQGRNALVMGFLDTPAADWLWMLDSDMALSATALKRLLASADPDQRPIMGGLCFNAAYKPTMYEITSTNPTKYESLNSWHENSCVQVDATGAACLLMHRSALEKIATRYQKPSVWFSETVTDGIYYGEDITFCMRAASVGVPIHVNTEVQAGHMKTEMIGKVQ